MALGVGGDAHEKRIVPEAPVVERQISNPVSSDELSLQVTVMSVVEVAVALTLLGVFGPGGAGVVAHEAVVKSEGGAVTVPTARTL